MTSSVWTMKRKAKEAGRSECKSAPTPTKTLPKSSKFSSSVRKKTEELSHLILESELHIPTCFFCTHTRVAREDKATLSSVQTRGFTWIAFVGCFKSVIPNSGWGRCMSVWATGSGEPGE
jgi:hypothetical protein